MSNKQDDFSKIYDEYIEKIYRFVFIKVNSQEIAEDLCSETFLRCWECFKKRNSAKIENISAFLYKIARNLIIDYYRKKDRIQLMPTNEMSVIDPNLEIDLEQKSFLNSDLGFVKTAINNLKDDYQNVIICRYINDLSILETAKIIGKTEGATRVILHRALKTLKKEMENKEV